jgi:predicted dehydrogenase
MSTTQETAVRESTLPEVTRRDFLKAGVAAGVVGAAGLGGFYFGYGKALGNPVRVGVIGTGDEGSVLIGSLNPSFVEVKSICDVRPYNRHRAFQGEFGVSVRPGLMSVYGWKTEGEAKRHVKVYDGSYEELIGNAKKDGVEAVIIALPLHLRAPAAIAAMKAGLHVITEKLMGHSVGECKEMARVAKQQNVHLATGHQRHYNVLYAEAMDKIQRGMLGDIHYIRAQWHRSNLPTKDSWSMPLPPDVKKDDKETKATKDNITSKLAECLQLVKVADGKEYDLLMKRIAQYQAQIEDQTLGQKDKDGRTPAEALGYQDRKIPDGSKPYERPAIEELIRWRLWDRTGAGLMAELGSHQLDAASIFISAMHGGHKQHPLRVVAAANRPIFGVDRDAEDHVFCIIEFPAPGYEHDDPKTHRRKIAVQYASINGNGYGGYGELVFGTKGTLLLEKETELTVWRGQKQISTNVAPTTIRVSGASSGAAATLDTQASGPSKAATGVSRGYAEELEHWAWCIRQNPAPKYKEDSSEPLPRCHPKVAMADAIIALTTNMAAEKGTPIAFQEAWFEPDRDETPEGQKPDLTKYA